jgi:hypothetical protein
MKRYWIAALTTPWVLTLLLGSLLLSNNRPVTPGSTSAFGVEFVIAFAVVITTLATGLVARALASTPPDDEASMTTHGRLSEFQEEDPA